mmetsp:Transcript_43675/g.95086  ORF Transcript_43675/g.95086 Transcript_43675/m.95086 type:complete len:201 (-) Transcript_43675:1535-2137(-)
MSKRGAGAATGSARCSRGDRSQELPWPEGLSNSQEPSPHITAEFWEVPRSTTEWRLLEKRCAEYRANSPCMRILDLLQLKALISKKAAGSGHAASIRRTSTFFSNSCTPRPKNAKPAKTHHPADTSVNWRTVLHGRSSGGTEVFGIQAGCSALVPSTTRNSAFCMSCECWLSTISVRPDAWALETGETASALDDHSGTLR